jgi:hypothetical protein
MAWMGKTRNLYRIFVGNPGSIPDEVTDFFSFSIYLILPAALCLGADSAANRNEYQKSSWACKANNLVSICELIF